jgi:hypothetical protein
MRNGLFVSLSMAALVVSVLPAGAQGRGQAVTLPDGPGKELVQMNCAKCHGLNNITNSWGNTRQGWHDLFGSMVQLPKDQADGIAA